MNEQRHAVLQSDALLGDDERALRQVVTAFADEVIAPASYEANRTRTLPIGIVRQMGELGLFGLPFPEAVGGQGGGYMAFCLAVEAIARVDQSIAITLDAGVGLGKFTVGALNAHQWTLHLVVQ